MQQRRLEWTLAQYLSRQPFSSATIIFISNKISINYCVSLHFNKAYISKHIINIYSEQSSRMIRKLFVAVFLLALYFSGNQSFESSSSCEQKNATKMPSVKIWFTARPVYEIDNMEILRATCSITFSEVFDERPWEYKVAFRRDFCGYQTYGYYHLYTQPSMLDSKFWFLISVSNNYSILNNSFQSQQNQPFIRSTILDGRQQCCTRTIS